MALLHRRVLLRLWCCRHQVQHRRHAPSYRRLPRSLCVFYLGRHDRNGPFSDYLHDWCRQHLSSITTLWGETTTGSCNLKLDSDVSFFFSAVEILTDWSLAILPGILLWHIQMKAKVKLSVAVILGLGAFASCATIVRLRYLSLYSNPAEFMFSTGKIGLWSVIEEGIGIIAGSLHALRPLLSLGIFNGSLSGKSSGPSTAQLKHSKSGHQVLGSVVQLDNMNKNKDTDGDSQKHILKETQVTVMTNDPTAAGSEEWERSQVLGWKKSTF
ncbi:hypothetical protein DH86_00003615 [Scytalidium sp. 3C]|nr:hypothetical protein DH86_00003615 [Scytalidium sp. 3C]